jgi:hemerythrin-like domain-containing protein
MGGTLAQLTAGGLALHQKRLGDNRAMRPGQSYVHPFELLTACHQRIERSLALLALLCEHLASQGADTMARDAARDVLRYFDIAAPLHHQDEERHVFPALAQDAHLAPLCDSLRGQHREMEAQWQVLRSLLQTLDPKTLPALQAAAEAFTRLQLAHLQTENTLVLPSARSRLDTQAQAAMGQEMAARRGLTL